MSVSTSLSTAQGLKQLKVPDSHDQCARECSLSGKENLTFLFTKEGIKENIVGKDYEKLGRQKRHGVITQEFDTLSSTGISIYFVYYNQSTFQAHDNLLKSYCKTQMFYVIPPAKLCRNNLSARKAPTSLKRT